MRTKLTSGKSKKFESFEAVNDEMLKMVLGGDTNNPPPEDGSDTDNLNNQVTMKKIIW